MSLTLDHQECSVLAQALDNYLPLLRRDVARTDVHRLQHELAVFEEALESLRVRLTEEQSEPGPPVDLPRG